MLHTQTAFGMVCSKAYSQKMLKVTLPYLDWISKALNRTTCPFHTLAIPFKTHSKKIKHDIWLRVWTKQFPADHHTGMGIHTLAPVVRDRSMRQMTHLCPIQTWRIQLCRPTPWPLVWIPSIRNGLPSLCIELGQKSMYFDPCIRWGPFFFGCVTSIIWAPLITSLNGWTQCRKTMFADSKQFHEPSGTDQIAHEPNVPWTPAWRVLGL